MVHKTIALAFFEITLASLLFSNSFIQLFCLFVLTLDLHEKVVSKRCRTLLQDSRVLIRIRHLVERKVRQVVLREDSRKLAFMTHY